MTRILLFSGSARADSLNQKLCKAAAKMIEQQGGKATVIDLKDYEMPLFNQDIEDPNREDYPENVVKLRELMESHDGWLIASPEYNGQPSPLLKNTIDWVSREKIAVFSGKPVGLMSASPGGMGGIRGLPHLRILLSNINALVIGEQTCVGSATEAFAADGGLANESQAKMLTKQIKRLVDVATKLKD